MSPVPRLPGSSLRGLHRLFVLPFRLLPACHSWSARTNVLVRTSLSEKSVFLGAREKKNFFIFTLNTVFLE